MISKIVTVGDVFYVKRYSENWGTVHSKIYKFL